MTEPIMNIYELCKQANQMSKSGQESEALNMMEKIADTLPEQYHESYGWIIYRYLKVKANDISSQEVRRKLFNYINLKNVRPSLLHSMILTLALKYYNTLQKEDFHFYNFLQQWGLQNLREEDVYDGYLDNKVIPSLISRICRAFVEKNLNIPIEEFIHAIPWTDLEITDMFRQPFFWFLMNLQKEKRYDALWTAFQLYNHRYSSFGPSPWHSEILNLAIRFMEEKEAWRFPGFFQKWGVGNLREKDWIPQIGKNKEIYKPVAVKAIQKCYDVIFKNKQNINSDFLNILKDLYEQAVSKFRDDKWLVRELAQLYIRQKNYIPALNIYKELIFDPALSGQYYIWQEFASCITDNKNIQISLLVRALSLQKNEDFLGNLRLQLAQLCIENKLYPQALFELNKYKEHYDAMKWQSDNRYTSLLQSLPDNTSAPVNIFRNYTDYMEALEEYISQDLPQQYGIVDYVNKEKHVLHIINANSVLVFFKYKNKGVTKGTYVRYHFHSQMVEGEEKISPVTIYPVSPEEALSHFKKILVVVDHINEEKNVFHVIFSNDHSDLLLSFKRTQLCPSVGDFLHIIYVEPKDKEGNKKRKILAITPSVSRDRNLRKTIIGYLQLKYKDPLSANHLSGNETDTESIETNADFAFIDNTYYVPRDILLKYKINCDCQVKAVAVFTGKGGKWRVYNIEKI